MGDEMDGMDETLVPSDYTRSGMITDDDLREILVLPVPEDCRLTCVLDCCHSGTLLDLPYKVKISPDGSSAECNKKAPGQHKGRRAPGDIVMISGCMDDQTSADIGAGAAGNAKAAGAMTTAFKNVVGKNKSISTFKMLLQMRQFLKQRGFTQVPQVSSEQFLDLTDPFLPEAKAAQAASVPAPVQTRPPNRRGLTIGINYLNMTQGRLAGCINDSDTIIGLMKEFFGYQDNEICRLRDDRNDMMPTRANMIQAMKWLVEGCEPGDEMFFHYSGHGGQTRDNDGDEISGMDNTLIPCDFRQAGQIIDDEIFNILVRDLPAGSRMWVILDCCHSGTALDLQYKVKLSPDGRKAQFTKAGKRHGAPPANANVIMISGCKDDQTSADIQGGSLSKKAAGAMTTALRHCLQADITCEDLIKSMRQFIKRNGFAQVPQLSSEQFVKLDSSFVNYEGKKNSMRGLSLKPGKRNKFGTRDLPGNFSSGGVSAPAAMNQGAMMDRLQQLEGEMAALRAQQLSPMASGGQNGFQRF
jgi:hypothetical protein